MVRKQEIARSLGLLLIAVVIGTALAVVLSRATPREQGGPVLPASFLVNQPAPDFTLPLLGGGEVSLSGLKGKVVVLDFWASWCPPCVATLPGTADVAQKYADRNVVVYAINVNEAPEEIEAFLKANNISIPTALARQSGVDRQYGVQYIPQLFVIDPNGTVHAANRDLDDLHGWLERSIESALKVGQAS